MFYIPVATVGRLALFRTLETFNRSNHRLSRVTDILKKITQAQKTRVIW
jgi:hypothetical protein